MSKITYTRKLQGGKTQKTSFFTQTLLIVFAKYFPGNIKNKFFTTKRQFIIINVSSK